MLLLISERRKLKHNIGAILLRWLPNFIVNWMFLQILLCKFSDKFPRFINYKKKSKIVLARKSYLIYSVLYCLLIARILDQSVFWHLALYKEPCYAFPWTESCVKKRSHDSNQSVQCNCIQLLFHHNEITTCLQKFIYRQYILRYAHISSKTSTF